MKPITFYNPRTLIFGDGCSQRLVDIVRSRHLGRLFVITFPQLPDETRQLLADLAGDDVPVEIHDEIEKEPTVRAFHEILQAARDFAANGVIGIGGGSVLDVAKLVAALCWSQQSLEEVIGIDRLRERGTFLMCLPTTSGTGSEVSPNAILLDERDQLKKGIISPHLVPDVAVVDPVLTHSVPPNVTAYTGIDALTHCIEAYANRNAHAMVDLYALEGIRRISRSLEKAVSDGRDARARADVALGSLYGGQCLGPVNTAAVHALAYPLGGEFHVAHGLSNAVLLPHVMAFNLQAAPERYAEVARALGVDGGGDDVEVARRGVERIRQLIRNCGLPTSLEALNIPQEAIEGMAKKALIVQRLLKNNLKEISLQDAVFIYKSAFAEDVSEDL